MIDTILFDMDGVLIDAKEWHYDSLNRALVSCGFNAINYDDHLKFFDGLPTKRKLTKYMEIYNVNLLDKIEQICDKKQEFTLEIANKLLTNDEPKIQMLKYLKENGYNVACCSNSIRKSVEFFLRKAGLIKYFNFVLSNEDVKKPKPDPEIYLEAIKRFNTTPNNVLIFEDNINGITAAKATNSHVYEVKNPATDLTKNNIINILNSLVGEND